MTAAALAIVGTVIQLAASGHIGAMYTGRLVAGIGVGAASAVVPSYGRQILKRSDTARLHYTNLDHSQRDCAARHPRWSHGNLPTVRCDWHHACLLEYVPPGTRHFLSRASLLTLSQSTMAASFTSLATPNTWSLSACKAFRPC